MKKNRFTPEEVDRLVARYRRELNQPEDFLRHMLSSPELFAFLQMAGTIPASYEEDIKEIIKKVLPKVFSDFLEMEN